MGTNLFGIGIGELIFLAVLALIVFGPKRLPEIARTVGRLVQQFRQATDEAQREVRQLVDEAQPWLGQELPAPLSSLAAAPDSPLSKRSGEWGKVAPSPDELSAEQVAGRPPMPVEPAAPPSDQAAEDGPESSSSPFAG